LTTKKLSPTKTGRKKTLKFIVTAAYAGNDGTASKFYTESNSAQFYNGGLKYIVLYIRK
jgi:hypothetical protein